MKGTNDTERAQKAVVVIQDLMSGAKRRSGWARRYAAWQEYVGGIVRSHCQQSEIRYAIHEIDQSHTLGLVGDMMCRTSVDIDEVLAVAALCFKE